MINVNPGLGLGRFDWQFAAKMEIARRLTMERGRFYKPNLSFQKYLNSMKFLKPEDLHSGNPDKPNVFIFILRGPNGLGKSAFIQNLNDYLMEPYENPYFDAIPILKNFPRPARNRILTTPNAAKTTYVDERNKWALKGRFDESKQGASFDRLFTYKKKLNGVNPVTDIFTFDQGDDQGESVTLSAAFVDEPMDHKHWTALMSRFRFGGIVFLLLTPLQGSGWYHDELETPERLNKDVFVTIGEYEHACKDHEPRFGHLPHAYFESIRRNCLNENEIRARLGGEYYELGGRALQTWSPDHHVFKVLPNYFDDCYKKGLFTLYCTVDPHPRKAWAIGWDLVFPNEDIVRIAEYPSFNFYRDHHWHYKFKDYALLLKSVEEQIGKQADFRFMDPNSGRGPSGSGELSVMDKIAEEGDLIGYNLVFSTETNDDIEAGIIVLNDLLGDPKNEIRSRFYSMDYCINTVFSMGHCGYKEEKDESKGMSVRLEMRYKDHFDTVRYPAMSSIGYKYIAPRNPRPPLWVKPVMKSPGYRSII